MSISRRALLSAAVLLPTTATVLAVTSGTANAYEWSRTLAPGAAGDDVTQLQIRVGGYPGYGSILALDGAYGPATTGAVAGFQQAYGLDSDGIAGPVTFQKIYEIQSPDGSPAHFEFGELNQCNGDWSGGAVSADTAWFNALVMMWKLEALRHALGDQPISLSDGFRSYSCNDATGGASDSRHLYGDAADLIGSHSFCTMAQQARYHGFSGILGPGFPGHDDHVHLSGNGDYWSAPDCGI